MNTDDYRIETTHFDEMKYKSWAFGKLTRDLL